MKPEAVARGERLLGSRAVSWARVESRGYARNEHWTLVLADGTRAFVKTAWLEPSVSWMRREREVFGAVAGAFMPRLLGFEDGEQPLLVLEDLTPGAHWPPPWRPGDVDAVLATLAELAGTRPNGVPQFGRWGGWWEIADDPQPFLALGLVSAAWLARALPALVAAEESTPFAGEALVHGDVRSDNLCIRGNRAVLVDWNHARCGNPGFDVAAWLPSLALEGGPAPKEVARVAPGASDFAVALAGFFGARAGLPAPEGAPLVRGFQLAQLEVALPWACAVLGLPPPDR